MENWKNKVVYQIYPMSFNSYYNNSTGDIRGIIEKLDYLKTLGVGIIWLTPVYESPMKDNGYDISDYYNVNELFGNMKDLEELITELHKKDMKLIMDLVVNHCSCEHRWFKEAVADKNSKYRDYFLFSDTKLTNQKGFFSEDCWEYNEEAEAYYYHLFAKEQPDLNWDNEDMRNEIYTMINWWLDKGVDGFRLDVIDLIGKIPSEEKFTSPKAHLYLKEMHKKCFEGRDVFTVGETPFADIENAIQYSAPESNELSMVFGFEHIGLDEQKGDGKNKWDLKTLDLKDLKDTFSKWQMALDEKGWNSLFWNNHDQPRIVSRFGNDKEFRVESAKMLAVLLDGLKGTPYVYQGEEIGMTNTTFSFDEIRDVETFNMIKEREEKGIESSKIYESINAKGRDNARTPFQWNDNEFAGFSSVEPWIKVNPNYKEINAEKCLNEKNSIFYTYQNLIKLRTELDVLVNGKYELIQTDNYTYCYTRTLANEKIIVVCNFYEKPTEITIDLDNTNILEHNYDSLNYENGKIKLKPYEAVMLHKVLG